MRKSLKYLVFAVVVMVWSSACTTSKRGPASQSQPTSPTAAPSPTATASSTAAPTPAPLLAPVKTKTTSAEIAAEAAAAPVNPDVPAIPDNPGIAAEGPLTLRDVTVRDSAPVRPTQYGVLIDRATQTLLVDRVYVERASYGVGGYGARPSYPAEGVVSVRLAENQWVLVQAAKAVAIQPVARK